MDCGWLAKPLFVNLECKARGQWRIKMDLSLCVLSDFHSLSCLSHAGAQRPSSGKHKQQGWLATYCLVSFQRHPPAVLDRAALYFTSSGPVPPAGQASVRLFFLAVGLLWR